MRTVLALGGNALLRRGERLHYDAQRRAIAGAARAVATVAREHAVVVTHGNGPQIGWLALRAELGRGAPEAGVTDAGVTAAGVTEAEVTLDVLGAETEGMIGYLLEQELAAELPDRHLATLLTRVLVDGDDPAFARPTKPIGPIYDERAAQRLDAEHGWAMGREAAGWRRLVPSPEPRSILELSTIRLLLDAGRVVVCAGGGGIPVARRADGKVAGVEAVVDKDLTSSLLARELDCDVLALLTDQPAVYRDWPQRQEPIGQTTASEARRLALEAGSMGPKVEAACRFVESTGRRAAIGALEQAAAVVAGDAGTQVIAK